MGDPQIEGRLDRLEGLGVIGRPVAEGRAHGTISDGTHGKAVLAEFALLHRVASLVRLRRTTEESLRIDGPTLKEECIV